MTSALCWEGSISNPVPHSTVCAASPMSQAGQLPPLLSLPGGVHGLHEDHGGARSFLVEVLWAIRRTFPGGHGTLVGEGGEPVERFGKLDTNGRVRARVINQPATCTAGDNIQLVSGGLGCFWSEGDNAHDPFRPGQKLGDRPLGFG